MRAALGYDRSHTDAQMGTEMTSREIPLTLSQFAQVGEHHLQATARAEALAKCEMTDEECGTPAPWITPAAHVAAGTEWLEFRCAYSYQCGANQSHAVVLDSYDKASEMHLCRTCHAFDVANYSTTVTVRTRTRTPEWVLRGKEEYRAACAQQDIDDAGFDETDETECEPRDKYTLMRKYLTTNSKREPRARIRVVGNVSNNNGRRASLSGDSAAGYNRPWIIKSTMRNTVNFERYYLVRHMVTGESRIVWGELLHNLY